jgi:hypothetical protein
VRKAFAVAATLAALAACDAFESSKDAKTSGDAGLDATATSADGSTSSDDAQPSHAEAAVPDAAPADGGFCDEANRSGGTIACEDFEGTSASHGFSQEAIGLTATMAPVDIGRAPTGLVVNGTLSGSNAVGGVAYVNATASAKDVRLRFMIRVVQLVHAGGSGASHAQFAGLFYGGSGWSIKWNRDGTASTMSTTVGSTLVEGASRMLATAYEIWFDVIHADAGGLNGQLYIDRQPIGGPQLVADPTGEGWLVRAGAQLADDGDTVQLQIDDVLLRELP